MVGAGGFPMSFPLILAIDPTEVIPVLASGGGMAIGVVGIVASNMRRASREREREQTRREIAAYVAEGSMTPEDGAKLIAAGGGRQTACGPGGRDA